MIENEQKTDNYYKWPKIPKNDCKLPKLLKLTRNHQKWIRMTKKWSKFDL